MILKKTIYTIEDNYVIVPRSVINRAPNGYIVKGGKVVSDFYNTQKEAEEAVTYMKENHIIK